MSLFKADMILQPSGVTVQPSPIHGLGVFSRHIISKGALIERAPLILLETSDKEYLQHTTLYHYYFVVKNSKTPAALGLGYSSLYNHSYHANARYEVSVRNQCLDIIAVRAIAAGEEITLNYNGRVDDNSQVFFPNPST